MPHAIEETSVFPAPQPTINRKSKGRNSSRESQHTSALLEEYRTLFEQSALSNIIVRQLQASRKYTTTPVSRILSLGLGSLSVVKGQARRLKQLTILLAVRDTYQRISGTSIDVYAQDPTFTRADEAFLTNLGIRILRTPHGSELGEAKALIDPSTVVYSPFLTLEVYEQLLVKSVSPVQQIIGDDFNALLSKWPKHSAERGQVEGMMKYGLTKYRRRGVIGEGFWESEDGTFPMAIYDRTDNVVTRRERAKI